MHANTELCFDLIRHGQSVAQLHPELIGGRTAGAPLTPLGYSQANALGTRLEKEGVNYELAFSSPFPRAIQTAMSVCAWLDYYASNIITVNDIIELDQGEWEGRSRGEVFSITHAPGLALEVMGTSPWFTPPGGESQKTVQRRMSEWFESTFLKNGEYMQSGRQWRFAIFGHGTAFCCFLQDILEFKSVLIGRGLIIDNCSLTRLRFNRQGWFVDSINDVGHLVGLENSRY
ncbi:MAG: histidine phosphatase family protein [bacterium]|nr:histidine phosphatase family protein [bacterium]